MKLLYALFSLAIMSATTLVLASPAQAAAGQIGVTVCGSSTTWYVNSDEGDRTPLPTSDGLVFSSNKLIHHVTLVPLANLKPGTFVANPAPDQPSFFSVEAISSLGAYGTLRWDGSKWSITIGAGTGSESPAVTPGQFSDTDPVALLAGKVTKWGPFDPDTNRVVSFGVGYTNAPPGTVATLVSSITFMTNVYSLSCASGTSPSPVPGPTQTVIKTVTVTPNPTSTGSGKTCAQIGHRVRPGDPDYAKGPGKPDADGDGVGCESYPEPTTTDSPFSGLNTAPVTATEPPLHLTPDPELVPASNATSLVFWGSLVALLAGLALLVVAIAGIVRSRRYRAAHSTDNSQTTMISPMYSGDDDYGVGDYDPSSGDYDPALGGHAGESYQAGHNAEAGDDTKPIPPVE